MPGYYDTDVTKTNADGATVTYDTADLTAYETELAAWVPDATAQALGAAVIAAVPGATMAIVPMVQPGKIHGVWTLGQTVVTVPGVAIAAANVWAGAPEGTLPYHAAKDAAAKIAKDYLTANYTCGGTVATAIIHADGTPPATFEDYL
jgi:hypothetical protein